MVKHAVEQADFAYVIAAAILCCINIHVCRSDPFFKIADLCDCIILENTSFIGTGSHTAHFFGERNPSSSLACVAFSCVIDFFANFAVGACFADIFFSSGLQSPFGAVANVTLDQIAIV